MWSTNELSANANGGTEMMQRGLWDRLPPNYRDAVHIICSRVRELHPEKPNILWHHDLSGDPEAARAMTMADRFIKHVFVSHWQWEGFKKQYGLKESQKVILKNAIDPIPAHEKPSDGPIRLIYHTTPHRGLTLLYPAFAYIYKNIRQDIQLDVYSSFEMYGWPQRDEPYKELFEALKAHPAITYHGYKPNAEIREALQKAHIFAYPSIWPETSCIAAIEAMSAGCLLVMPRYGALPETCFEFPIWYEWHEDIEMHLKIFTTMLIGAIDTVRKPIQSHLSVQKEVTDAFYSWGSRIIQWKNFLRSLGVVDQE